ncbi:MAG: CxxH/CxxC protein [Bacillaceae bacterium]
MKINCCEEHTELALDVIIDECETVPYMEKLSTEQNLSTTCEYCQNKAVYIIFTGDK